MLDRLINCWSWILQWGWLSEGHMHRNNNNVKQTWGTNRIVFPHKALTICPKNRHSSRSASRTTGKAQDVDIFCFNIERWHCIWSIGSHDNDFVTPTTEIVVEFRARHTGHFWRKGQKCGTAHVRPGTLWNGSTGSTQSMDIMLNFRRIDLFFEILDRLVPKQPVVVLWHLRDGNGDIINRVLWQNAPYWKILYCTVLCCSVVGTLLHYCIEWCCAIHFLLAGMQPAQPYRHGTCCFASVTMSHTN